MRHEPPSRAETNGSILVCAECPIRAARGLGPADPVRWFIRGGAGIERRTADADTVLLRSGDNFGSLGAIFTGWALRYKLLDDGRRQILDVLLPGDLFGLEAVLLEKLQHQVEAVTPVTYGVMADEHVKRMIGGVPHFAASLLSRLVHEQARQDRHVTLLGRSNAEERVATFLVELHTRLRRRRLGHTTSFNMPLTQQQIGDYLGLTVVHINRVLRRFRESGIVTARGKAVLIHDFPALYRFIRFADEIGAPPLPGDLAREKLEPAH
jgi:CRP-like cAMP-binding protein